MFGNVIYFDDKKMRDYKSFITGKRNLKIDTIQISTDKGVSLDFSVLGADIKSTKNYDAKIEESLLYDCDEFEKLLEGRDDYFDFTNNESCDIKTIPRGYIIKFDSFITIPESFDFTQLLDQLKPMLIGTIDDLGESDKQAFESFFKTSDIKIPLIFELDNLDLCSKVESNFMKIRYNQLEEYENIDVTVLARVVSNSIVNKSKPIYEPLKDYMTMNRTTRRSFINNKIEGLNELYNDEDYMNIEVIAIYQ